MSPRAGLRAIAGATLLLALVFTTPIPVAAQQAPAGGHVADYAANLKRVQVRMLREGAQRRMERARALAHLLKKHPELRARLKMRRPRDADEGSPQAEQERLATARAAAPAAAQTALEPNVRMNDPTGDDPTSGQCEQSIAGWNNYVLVAWNDGQGYFSNPYGPTQGYGWSNDGGLTFHDGGSPPAPSGWTWSSDPVVVVNEKTGEFWYCGMLDQATQNGLGVVKATFVADTLQWAAPQLVRSASNSIYVFDKPWLAVDSLSSRLYLTYSTFTTTGDLIAFQRSAAGGGSWEAAVQLSASAENGYVQGSRPCVGPSGELYVVWYSINPNPPYLDWMRIRKSTNQGVSFGAPANAATFVANFGSGAPGFNRGQGISFPSIAVDRSNGAHRGRVYVGWNESINFYDDVLDSTNKVTEVEDNGAVGTATHFTVGQAIRGTVSSTSDFDYFSFSGTAGKTLIVYAEYIGGNLDNALRLFCSDGTTRLALSAPGQQLSNFFCYTLPTTGTYYLRCASLGGTGNYLIDTGYDVATVGDRARDHRDAFVAWSDDGTLWSTPVRANDSPPNYDDWFPELAVAGTNGGASSGNAYCMWYDWRDSPVGTCGGVSNVYLSRSADGGVSWTAVGPLTDASTAWSNVATNIAPNQGDYLGLYANHSTLYAAWADGRNGNPDVYGFAAPLGATPTEVALASAVADPDRVTLTWFAGGSQGFSATVERRTATGDWGGLGTVSADGSGYVVWVDHAVAPGGRYAYRLVWQAGGASGTTPEIWVDVPTGASFALEGARPNPAVNGIAIAFSLPDARPATLELLDVSGRRVATRTVTGPGNRIVNLSEGRVLQPGIYLARLTLGGRSLTAHVTLVR